jgi:hypothetical protein
MRKILHNAVCMGSSMQRKTFLYLGHITKITCLASSHFNFSRSGGRFVVFFVK